MSFERKHNIDVKLHRLSLAVAASMEPGATCSMQDLGLWRNHACEVP